MPNFASLKNAANPAFILLPSHHTQIHSLCVYKPIFFKPGNNRVHLFPPSKTWTTFQSDLTSTVTFIITVGSAFMYSTAISMSARIQCMTNLYWAPECFTQHYVLCKCSGIITERLSQVLRDECEQVINALSLILWQLLHLSFSNITCGQGCDNSIYLLQRVVCLQLIIAITRVFILRHKNPLPTTF